MSPRQVLLLVALGCAAPAGCMDVTRAEQMVCDALAAVPPASVQESILPLPGNVGRRHGSGAASPASFVQPLSPTLSPEYRGEGAETAPPTQPDPQPTTQPKPAPPPTPLPDIGPVDQLGERPRLIRDASPAAREVLAKKLVNPISDLIRVPVQMSYDEGFGPAAANRFVWTVTPFVPFRLNENWNLITQTRVPLVHQQSPFPGPGDECGLGDISQTFLLAPQDRRHLWAVGPTFLFPTAGHEFLGVRKWGAGPTGIALVQEGPWTAGVIASHLWSLAGDDERPNLNVTTVSPFVGYTTHDAWTVLLELDTIYDWDNPVDDPWSVPVNLTVSRVRRLGRHLVNLGVGGRYFVSTPENGPEWGVRVFVTFLFRR